MLFRSLKYVFLHDLAPIGQTGSNGYNSTPAQRSQVLSADFSYDLTSRLSVGGKYAYRLSEISLSRDTGNFVRQTASLGVARFDVKLFPSWELMLEGRVFDIEDSGIEYGTLAGLWYRVNDNIKLGGGYSTSRLSDDLTDLTTDNSGWFINVASQF